MRAEAEGWDLIQDLMKVIEGWFSTVEPNLKGKLYGAF